MSTNRPILIDSDMLLFACASATEHEVEWQPDLWVLWASAAEARNAYWNAVDAWCEQFSSTREDCWHCFSEGGSFRNTIYPRYKQGRRHRKPLGYLALREELMKESQATVYQGKLEADDTLSILADLYRQGGAEPIIASGDKDLGQVPGTHAWIRAANKRVGANPLDPKGQLTIIKNDSDLAGPTAYEVSPQEAIRYTWFQSAMGDTTDSVPGCPGIGEARALKWANTLPIENSVECWKRLVHLYAKNTKADAIMDWVNPVEEALLQSRLTRLLTAEQYDIDTHTIALWEPPIHVPV